MIRDTLKAMCEEIPQFYEDVILVSDAKTLEETGYVVRRCPDCYWVLDDEGFCRDCAGQVDLDIASLDGRNVL